MKLELELLDEVVVVVTETDDGSVVLVVVVCVTLVADVGEVVEVVEELPLLFVTTALTTGSAITGTVVGFDTVPVALTVPAGGGAEVDCVVITAVVVVVVVELELVGELGCVCCNACCVAYAVE